MSNKEQWDLESAMKVLQHPTVDAKLWAEAVEWLLRYGPPAIKKILLQASHNATEMEFPELRPVQYTPDGQPIYDIAALAKALGISKEEVQRILEEKDTEEEIFQALFSASQTVH